MTAAQPGRRERKKQATRASLIESCCHLIETEGVEGATVEALCDAVDISKKTFYNYFDTKNDLLLEICQSHLLAGIEGTIDAALASDGDCSAQLDLVFESLFEGQASASAFDLALIDYLVSNFSRNRGASIGLLDEWNAQFTRFFTAHAAALAPGQTPAFCGEMTAGMINAVMLNWINHPGEIDREKIPAVCAMIKRSMLRADAV